MSKYVSTFLPSTRSVKKSESIRINSVIVTSDENRVHSEFCHYNILNELLKGLDEPGAGDTISFHPGEIIPASTFWSSEKATIRIVYTVEENSTFFVCYDAKQNGFIEFPPYGIDEKPVLSTIKSSYVGSKSKGFTEDITHQVVFCAGPRNNFYSDCDEIGVVKNYICSTPVYPGEINVHNITFSDGKKLLFAGNERDSDNGQSVNVIGHILAGGYRTPDMSTWESFPCMCVYGKKCPKGWCIIKILVNFLC